MVCRASNHARCEQVQDLMPISTICVAIGHNDWRLHDGKTMLFQLSGTRQTL
jgi:hypothetical protein